jgi:hypothetical protein
LGKAFASNLYHPTLNPGAVDISHQLINILVNWQVYSKNLCVAGIFGKTL